MAKIGATQKELQDAICQNLHNAQHAIALASHLMTSLEADPAFVSLAKVTADNLATMVANLETRIKYPAK